MYPHLVTNNTVTIIRNGETHTTTSDSPTFEEVLSHIRNNDWDLAVDTLSPRAAIENYAGTHLRIEGSRIINVKTGETINNAIVPHILSMRANDFDVAPLMNFLANVLANPSMRSRNQIWRFVETNKIAITPTGTLLFYKRVRSNYYDVHTGRTNCYEVGTTHTMPRHLVDDDPESTCSTGLHVCSYEYLRSFQGERTLLCEVNPSDIVSVPIDYENSKVRVCSLTVLQEVTNPQPLDTGVYVQEDTDDLDF